MKENYPYPRRQADTLHSRRASLKPARGRRKPAMRGMEAAVMRAELVNAEEVRHELDAFTVVKRLRAILQRSRRTLP